MSSIAFNSFTPSNAAQMTATARTGPAPDAPVPGSEEDTVTLSASAQAEALHQGGASVSSIAASLGTSEQIVDSYLSISPAASVPVAAAPAGHAAHAVHTGPATPASAEPAAQATPVAAPELPAAVPKG